MVLWDSFLCFLGWEAAGTYGCEDDDNDVNDFPKELLADTVDYNNQGAIAKVKSLTGTIYSISNRKKIGKSAKFELHKKGPEHELYFSENGFKGRYTASTEKTADNLEEL